MCNISYFFSDDLREYPLVRGETEAFGLVKKNKKFIWKVYSTVGYSKYRLRSADWTWDHLSFAFYFPNNNQRFYISPGLCDIETAPATNYYPYSRSNYDGENRRDVKAWSSLVSKLERKTIQA